MAIPRPPPLPVSSTVRPGTATFDLPSEDGDVKVVTFDASIEVEQGSHLDGGMTPTSQVFKAFVSTASGQFLNVVRLGGSQRGGALLPEGVERSHVAGRLPSSASCSWREHTSWSRFDSPRTWSSAGTSALVSPQGDPAADFDEDGCWARVDKPACAILTVVTGLGLVFAIGLKEDLPFAVEAIARLQGWPGVGVLICGVPPTLWASVRCLFKVFEQPDEDIGLP